MARSVSTVKENLDHSTTFSSDPAGEKSRSRFTIGSANPLKDVQNLQERIYLGGLRSEPHICPFMDGTSVLNSLASFLLQEISAFSRTEPLLRELTGIHWSSDLE